MSLQDFNFFQKVTVSSASFASVPDCTITFVTKGALLISASATAVIEFSLNGTTVHGEIDGAITQGLAFDNRVISKLFFRLKSGSSTTVDVQAW